MKFLNSLLLNIRAAIFWLGFAFSTIIAGLIIPLLWLVPPAKRYATIKQWNRFNAWWLKVTCNVRYHIQGQENIRQGESMIIMATHQSTWETLALPGLFTQNLSWVLKRELLNIPIFGWGLRLIKPIAIDRGAGRAAVKQVVDQGKNLLNEGQSVVIFPEGTRVAPGKKVRYKMGGAILAAESGFPILPIAHNAGECWPRAGWIKYPGTITVSIGELIPTQGKTAEEIIKQVEQWIEAEKQQLPPARD